MARDSEKLTRGREKEWGKMLNISLRDKNVMENLKAINELKQFGFSEKEIQELYDKQLESDNPELLKQ